ncbi:hypothetical protein PAMA_008094 [Pampus argenteus]
MKVAIVFVLLFATVLSLPVRKVSDSSESSEEVVRQPAAAPVQNAVAAAAAGSDESKESSDEDMQAAAEAPVEVKSGSADTPSASNTASVNSQDSEDSDDDDADESETEDDGDDASHSSESGESSTPAPATVIPVVVTEEPVAETTSEPILPTIVTDTDSGRGDSLGGYPSDYKSIVYVEDKSYHKLPAPYKSYEFYGTGKKMAYDMTDGNEVEKTLPVYKALQIHSDLLEEDTSTPEVENQGMDASQDQEITPRQAALPEEESTSTSDVTIGDGSASDATTSESSSATEEEEEEEESASTTSDSASASQESEDEESQSSEEATATPGAADSDSDESDSAESDSDEEGAGPDTATDATTDMPVVITAK